MGTVSRRWRSKCLLLLVCCAVSAGMVPAVQADFTGLELVHNYGAFNPAEYATRTQLPLAAVAVPGFPSLVGVAGKLGRIDLLDLTNNQSRNVLTIPADLNTLFDETPALYFDAFESGVAGLTFHPDFNNPANPNGYRKFYVNASFDNAVVPGSPFIPVGDPNAITQAEINALNAAAENDPNNSILRKCFVCDHPPMNMEAFLTNTTVVNGQTVGQFGGVNCFFDGPDPGTKPAQALNPMYTEVREYMVSDNGSPNTPAAWTVDQNEFKTVLRFLLPRDFHHAGDLQFGQDGMLYITTGDTKGHPTETHTYPEEPLVDLSGKVLRIDVSGAGELTPEELQAPLIRNFDVPPDNPLWPEAGTRNEVYAYGFRNPWRSSVDRVTGELWVADVGFITQEEVNRVTPGFDGGWPYFEGTFDLQNNGFGLPTSDPDGPGGPLPPHDAPPPFADTDAPAYSYSRPIPNNRTTAADNPTLGNPASYSSDHIDHDDNFFDPFYSRGAAVMGGVVYRGPDPTLQGKYIFYESGQRQVLMLNPNLSPADPNYVQDISEQFFEYSPPDTSMLTDWDDLNGDGQRATNGSEDFTYPAPIPRSTAVDGIAIGLMVSFGEDDAGNMYLVNHFDNRIYRLVTSNPDPDAILVGPGRRGDLNSDGLVDAKDINLLALSVRPGARPPIPVYDLNENGGVTYDQNSSGIVSDSDKLVRGVLMTNYGDVDLDDDIDTGDITATILNFAGAGNGGRTWATGDFNGDGDNDTGDITTVILNFTGAGGGAGAAIAAAHATDPVSPALVYDARTGETIVDPGSETILAFSLQSDGNFSASADFGELDASVLAGASSSLVDNTVDQIGWVSVAATGGLGLETAETIGTILPAGLSVGALSAILDHSWAGPHGAGGSFELVVIPEPSGLLLALPGVFILGMVVSQRHRRFARV